MSRALPAGGPSKISVNTTSASSKSTILCAVVDPTKPPPTTVTFFRLIFFSFGVWEPSSRFYGLKLNHQIVAANQVAANGKQRAAIRNPSRTALEREGLCSSLATGHCRLRHILNNRLGKGRRPQLRPARHQPFQIIRHALLLDSLRNPVLNEFRRSFPSQKLEHH